MNTEEERKPIHILLVEDNLGDVFLITQCLQQNTTFPYLHLAPEQLDYSLFSQLMRKRRDVLITKE